MPIKTIKEPLHLITFFFLALRLFFKSSATSGRIGADIILRLAWNCARRALTDNREIAVADDTSELFPILAEAFADGFDEVLLLNWNQNGTLEMLRMLQVFLYLFMSFTSWNYIEWILDSALQKQERNFNFTTCHEGAWNLLHSKWFACTNKLA